jgi:FkbM family methyltransferase
MDNSGLDWFHPPSRAASSPRPVGVRRFGRLSLKRSMKSGHLNFVAGHLLWSMTGLGRALLRHPLFALRLFWTRLRFFLTRQFRGPLPTPDGFVIETSFELISYWSFLIEREGCTRLWLEALAREPRPLVLDVGANAGLFTHLIWTLKPEAEIIAFDPLPKMAARLRAWQARTGAHLVVHNQAVADRCGTASFYAAAENDTGASLKPGSAGGQAITVPVTTLDSVIPERPVLLAKIDVEGAEVEVLAGAARTLAATRFLILEAHTAEALERIQRQLGPAWRARRVGASDYLFARAQSS